MKKRSALIGGLVAILLVFGMGVLMSADKPRLNFQTVNSPRQLLLALSAMDTEIDALRTLANEVRTDHGTTRTVDTDQTTLLNNLRTLILTRTYANPALAINSNFDITTGAFSYSIAGVYYSQAANQNFDTGTTATFPAGKWGIALLSLNAAGDETVTWATNTDNAGYDSEALAIAALPETPANHCPIGYATVQAAAGNSFTAGTDALQGGTGGNASQDTNYYNLVDPKGTITAAVTSSPPDALSASAVTEQVQRGK